MHKLAGEIISKNVKDIIDSWDFENMKKQNPEWCICYEEDKKCHKIERLNCFFCYCPEYDRTFPEGKCKIDSPDGKYIETANGRILDCSDCTFPHKRENAVKFIENLFK